MEDDIVKRYTTDKGLSISNLVTELHERVIALEEAMGFFSEWYNKTQRVNILIPEHLKDTLNND